MDLISQGTHSDKAFKLILKLFDIDDLCAQSALRLYVVKGVDLSKSAIKFNTKVSILTFIIKSINTKLLIHNKLFDVDIKEKTGLSTKQHIFKTAVNSCNYSLSDISKESGISYNTIRFWLNGKAEPKNIKPVLEAIKYLNMGQ